MTELERGTKKAMLDGCQTKACSKVSGRDIETSAARDASLTSFLLQCTIHLLFLYSIMLAKYPPPHPLG